MSVRIHDLPKEWYDSKHYRPRIATSEGSEWFTLHPSFRPLTGPPESTEIEPTASPEALLTALHRTRHQWGLPPNPKVMSPMQEGARAIVVTGQQPGFLGGPLYVFFKALTAIASARQIQKRTGRPCVPIFWVAGEDHDLDEVRTAHFPSAEGSVASFSYPGTKDRRPLSDYPIDAAAQKVIEDAKEHLRRRRFGDTAAELLDLYKGRNLASGFAAVLSKLLEHTGLLVLDPTNLRFYTAGLFERLIDDPAGALEAIERGRQEVEGKGIPPVVAGRLPLFLVENGQRHHLTLTGNGLSIDGGGRQFSRDELLKRLAAKPEHFSAGALLRPLLQQYITPCVLTIGGAAEVGYFAQLGPLAEHLNIKPPKIALRLNATLLDGSAARDVSPDDLIAIASAASPEGLVLSGARWPGQAAVADLSRHTETTLQELLKQIPDNTPGRKRLDSAAAKLIKDLGGFQQRLDKAWAQSREVEFQRATRLWNQVFPADRLQERHWSFLHYVAKHGTAWIDSLLELVSKDPLKLTHRLVIFE